MTNRFRFMLLSMATLGIVSCSDKLTDESGGINIPENDDGKVYMNVAVALPSASGTRSATDENDGETNSDAKPDYEVGHDFENDIKSIVLVLASKDGKYIAHNIIEAKDDNGTNTTPKKKYTATASFNLADITKAYSGPLANSKEVNVYAFCNNIELNKYFNELDADNTKWLDEVTEIGEDYNKPEFFFMSNSSVRTIEFPATESAWGYYNTEEKAYDLSQKGAIYVERAAARFDYRMSEKSTLGNRNNDVTTYNYELPENNELGKIVNVALAKMSLVNMSRKYYNLRRVSGDGKGNKDDMTIGGIETPSNYVVDTDWEHKSTEFHKTDIETLAEEFNFPLFRSKETDFGNVMYNESGWDTKTIYDVLNKGENGEDTWDKSEGNRYKIWRYVTENTIPAENTNQIAAHSTGVVFKAAIVADKNIDKVDGLSEELVKALKASKDGKKVPDGSQTGEDYYEYPTLYLYNNQLYAGINELVEVANDKETVLYLLVNKVLNNWYLNEYTKTFEYVAPNEVKEGAKQLTVEICDAILNGKSLDDDDIDNSNYDVDFDTPAFKNQLNNLMAGQNIAVYEAGNDDDLGGGYFCYYFYWNRHNDNDEATVMGPMEFATVRNNVYKLTVTAISQLGHPTNPDNDPDPVKPDDPDEEDKVYMKVNVEVLPWVVRVNDIEF